MGSCTKRLIFPYLPLLTPHRTQGPRLTVKVLACGNLESRPMQERKAWHAHSHGSLSRRSHMAPGSATGLQDGYKVTGAGGGCGPTWIFVSINSLARQVCTTPDPCLLSILPRSRISRVPQKQMWVERTSGPVFPTQPKVGKGQVF